ncbi:MAG: DUF3107 domain-containing protein [Actinobacteria bacterium]|nr:DUF3107 domain-containing protein [Actinomycetota bacterium]MCB9413431.1 DUF3107 domain-containing protein [Actinomycetota bacterium]
MEVRIGVSNAVRDITFESKSDQEDVAKSVAESISSGDVLALVDDKGRQYIIPADKIAFVELGESTTRRVGFGAG